MDTRPASPCSRDIWFQLLFFPVSLNTPIPKEHEGGRVGKQQFTSGPFSAQETTN
ncbi:hypothetical protein I79_023506 [Cricetulus griseus]|uniref:Uncharacterized protein n=1 Tax=Cricetulus griseus TaxID=10029 RepID=G3II44_CRIGR|nr:hypothetical protein I79_023506 [Cricetulus griseus]